MVGHGGSSASSYLADPTSPTPSQCASIVATSTLRVTTGLTNPEDITHNCMMMTRSNICLTQHGRNSCPRRCRFGGCTEVSPGIIIWPAITGPATRARVNRKIQSLNPTVYTPSIAATVTAALQIYQVDQVHQPWGLPVKGLITIYVYGIYRRHY